MIKHLSYINCSDLPFVNNNQKVNSFQSLENRFVKAMEQIAKLSLDKEQLEHLVARLQDETGIDCLIIGYNKNLNT